MRILIKKVTQEEVSEWMNKTIYPKLIAEAKEKIKLAEKKLLRKLTYQRLYGSLDGYKDEK